MCYVVSSIAVTDGRREAVVGAASQGGGADGDSDRGGLRAAVRRHPVKHVRPRQVNHVPTQSIMLPPSQTRAFPDTCTRCQTRPHPAKLAPTPATSTTRACAAVLSCNTTCYCCIVAGLQREEQEVATVARIV